MSVLSELFNDSIQIKIIEAFTENPEERLYVADISRTTGVAKITVMRHIKTLLEEGIILKAGKAGQVQFYQLNMENPKVQIILFLEKCIENENLGELLEKNNY